MKINFVFPMPATSPVGGYKVVYEYANRLVALGQQVVISYQFIPNPAVGKLKNLLRFLKWRCMPRLWQSGEWFALDPKIQLRLVYDISDQYIGTADVIVATAWQTAEQIADLGRQCGEKYYLIQHFESWSGDQERVLNTFRLPLKKIVIAKWLLELVRKAGSDASYIPNGLNHDEFYIDTPIEARNPLVIGTLYHQYEWKGTKDALAAIAQCRDTHPNLQVIMFGAVPAPGNLPNWVEYHYRPTGEALRRLYNRMSIFVSASWEEGWGLTPCEALLCGAAIVVTDNGGHREFAIDGKTGLLAPVHDVPAIAAQLLRLIGSAELKKKVSLNGAEYLKLFSWEDNALNFLDTIGGRGNVKN